METYLFSGLKNYSVHSEMISKYWLLGFVEGDGSFYISNNSAVFSLRQKDSKVLECIAEYLSKLPPLPPFNLANLFKAGKPYSSIRMSKNSQGEEAYSLTITDADVQFQYIYPFFNSLQFLSRKRIDFQLWSISLFLIMLGYHTLLEGKFLINKLKENSNNRRYASIKKESILLEHEINSLFDICPPFNIQSGLNHFSLAKHNANTMGSRKGFKVYIYDNGKEIEGSPFNSYRSGGAAIGLNSVSSIVNYIDSNKIFKGQYTFFSKPLYENKLKKDDELD